MVMENNTIPCAVLSAKFELSGKQIESVPEEKS